MATEHTLYDGEVTLAFDRRAHSYTVTDRGDGATFQGLVPSVTKITGILDKPALVQWAANQTAGHIAETWKAGRSYDEIEISEITDGARFAHRRASRRAANVGSLVHAYAEQHGMWKLGKAKQPEMPVNDLARRGAEAFLDWVDAEDVSFIDCERKVYSRQWGVAGTVDLIAEDPHGRMFVCDYKSSKAVYDEMVMQVAAYRHALCEEGFPVTGWAIARFDKETGEFEPHGLDGYAQAVAAFDHAVGLYRWLEARRAA